MIASISTHLQKVANSYPPDEKLPPFHCPEAPSIDSSVKHPSLVSNKEPALCGFFWKTGACRYGDLCSRLHPTAPMSEEELKLISENSPNPEMSHRLVLIFTNMFSHFSLQVDPQTPDDALEVDEENLESEYRTFYEDVYSELSARWGRIIGLRTCRNHSEHLRGNVYVEFSDSKAAMDALVGCQGRWYAKKPLNCRLAYLGCGWKGAVCGLFHHGDRCHKGDSGCNFLHVFLNPNEGERDVYVALNRNLPELPRSSRDPSPEEKRRRHDSDHSPNEYPDYRRYRRHRTSHSPRERRRSRSPRVERRYIRSYFGDRESKHSRKSIPKGH